MPLVTTSYFSGCILFSFQDLAGLICIVIFNDDAFIITPLLVNLNVLLTTLQKVNTEEVVPFLFLICWSHEFDI